MTVKETLELKHRIALQTVEEHLARLPLNATEGDATLNDLHGNLYRVDNAIAAMKTVQAIERILADYF